MPQSRKCELIKDGNGWWLQYENPCGACASNGHVIELGVKDDCSQCDGTGVRKRCTLMDATNETEAQLEAMQEGFTECVIWRDGKQEKAVKVPKGQFP